MGKPKHTPGPWKVGMRPGPMVYGIAGEQVADLSADLLPKEETRYNATLIAAAPDLLDVASGALGYLEALPAQCRPDEAWFAPLRLAIRKATGKE